MRTIALVLVLVSSAALVAAEDRSALLAGLSSTSARTRSEALAVVAALPRSEALAILGSVVRTGQADAAVDALESATAWTFAERLSLARAVGVRSDQPGMEKLKARLRWYFDTHAEELPRIIEACSVDGGPPPEWLVGLSRRSREPAIPAWYCHLLGLPETAIPVDWSRHFDLVPATSAKAAWIGRMLVEHPNWVPDARHLVAASRHSAFTWVELVRMVEKASPESVAAAAGALLETDHQVLRAVATRMGPDDRRIWIERRRDGTDGYFDSALVDALAGDPRDVAVLRRLATDEKRRGLATQARRRLMDVSPEDLMRMIGIMIHQPDGPWPEEAHVQLLSRLTGPEAWAAVLALVRSRIPERRNAALKEAIGHPQAAQVVAILADDPDPEVRRRLRRIMASPPYPPPDEDLVRTMAEHCDHWLESSGFAEAARRSATAAIAAARHRLPSDPLPARVVFNVHADGIHLPGWSDLAVAAAADSACDIALMDVIRRLPGDPAADLLMVRLARTGLVEREPRAFLVHQPGTRPWHWQVARDPSAATAARVLITSPDATDGLVRSGLDHPDPVIRRRSLIRIACLDPRAAATRALAAARGPDPLLRAGAMQALGFHGGTGAWRAIADGAKDPDPWVRVHAAWAIGGVAGPDALAVLRALLDDPQPVVRQGAVHGLVRRGEDGLRLLAERARNGDVYAIRQREIVDGGGSLAADTAFALGLFAAGDVETIGFGTHSPIGLVTSDHRSYQIDRSAGQVLDAAHDDGWRRGIVVRMSCD